jgi:hypothetical protein
MSDERDTPSGITLIQQKVLTILDSEVGMNGSLSKKEVLQAIGFTDTKNAARDIFKPLKEAGYISVQQKEITLIKLIECDDFEV